MKHLGKILFISFFLHTTLFGNVVATLNTNTVQRGETVTYTLKIDGSNIQKPNLQTLCNSDILSTSSQTNISMVNGDYAKTYSLNYTFMPKKSCVIPSLDVIIGGKKYKTKSLKLKVQSSQNIKDAKFVLRLSSKKKEIYVGEPFFVTFVIKQRNDAQVVDSKFIAPKFQGFWVKGTSKPQVSRDSQYITTRLVYKLAAQREGELSIDSAQVAIASRVNKRDMWGSLMPQIKWRSYFSNTLKIKAKPLPNKAKLIGNFELSASVDKKIINPNQAVNLTIKVVGDGNLEDIESFKPYISGVSVFDEKAKISGNTLTQKIALVADENFTIPSFSLAYFNMKTKRVEKISTKPIEIIVNGKAVKKDLEIKRAVSVPVVNKVKTKEISTNSFSFLNAIFIFLAGVVVGILLMLVKFKKLFEKKSEFNYKDEKQLLMKLLPYKEDKDVQEIMDNIESNLYTKTNKSLDKKRIKEILKRYDIS